MPKATAVKNIVIHCSAGFGNVESIKKFWRDTLGWRSPGYHIIVDLDGNLNQIAEFTAITNGVEGHNSDSIHICYIGGVEVAGKNQKTGQNIYKGKDTRTDAQKLGIIKAITRAQDWLKANGKDVKKDLSVVGHRDFSKDQNGDGIIASWERIKECPSFDAMREYTFFTSKNRLNLLPTVKDIVQKDDFIIYAVVPGDSLSLIAKKYDTTVKAIKELNELTTDVIQPRQKLKIK
jgi:N-acetylmuramoyl-L-alanine amidase